MSQRHRTVPCLISQLIREDNAYANKSCTWTYDGNGNILNKKTYAYTTGTLGTATAIETNTYSTGSFKDQMISHAGHTISYDALGNPLNWYNNTATFSNITWEGRKLTGMTVGSTAYTFSYNSDGIRTKKQNGSNVVEYLYDEGGNLVEEKHSNYSLYFIYDDANELIGFKVSNGGTYYYGKDVFGVIKYIYNASGTIVGTYTYDAWGNTISSTGTTDTNLNPIRYKDYYFDTESGFYYLQSRYYDPQVGRFISADDVATLCLHDDILGYNLYIYCDNNAINNADPYGYFKIPRSLISVAIDAVIWAVFSVGAASWATASQPIKAFARMWGKELLKVNTKRIFNGFISTFTKIVLKISTKLVPVIKSAVGWLLRSFVSKLTAEALASTILGGIISFTSNKFLDALIPNITIILSVGGLVAGLWDYFSDGALDGWIKLW